MAIFIPSGAIVAAINGTVDNIVYYRGKYGNVVRTWIYPANTITPFRTTVRTAFGSVSQAWSALTDSQRDQWDVFASGIRHRNRLGSVYTPDGFTVFMSRNVVLQSVGAGILNDPPAPDPLSQLFAIGTTPQTLVFFGVKSENYDRSAFVPANHQWVIAAGDQRTPNIESQFNRYRIIQSFGPGTAMNQNIYANYAATWSVPVLGNRIFLKQYYVNTLTGQESKPDYISALVIL